MPDLPAYPGTPRWVKLSGIVVGVLILLVIIVILVGDGLGRHGPGRHMSSGDAGRYMAASEFADVHTDASEVVDRSASTGAGR